MGVRAVCRVPSDAGSDLVALSAPLASEMVPFMTATELTSIAFAFGHTVEAGIGNQQEIGALLAKVVHVGAQAAIHFDGWHLVALLRSCARWSLPLALADVGYVLDALRAKHGELTPTQAEHV